MTGLYLLWQIDATSQECGQKNAKCLQNKCSQNKITFCGRYIGALKLSGYQRCWHQQTPLSKDTTHRNQHAFKSSRLKFRCCSFHPKCLSAIIQQDQGELLLQSVFPFPNVLADYCWRITKSSSLLLSLLKQLTQLQKLHWLFQTWWPFKSLTEIVIKM